MKKLLQAAAVVALGVGLTGGIASAATGGVDVSGPGSDVKVASDERSETSLRNNNTFRVTNNNPQHSATGDVRAHSNTEAGTAESGAAVAESMLDASLTLNNGGGTGAGAGTSAVGGAMGDVDVSGPNANVHVHNKATDTVRVTNNNDLQVTNNNWQRATSGNVNVSNNTGAGGATSGDATTTSNTSITFDVTN
jgi:hypothetical protein